MWYNEYFNWINNELPEVTPLFSGLSLTTHHLPILLYNTWSNLAHCWSCTLAHKNSPFHWQAVSTQIRWNCPVPMTSTFGPNLIITTYASTWNHLIDMFHSPAAEWVGQPWPWGQSTRFKVQTVIRSRDLLWSTAYELLESVNLGQISRKCLETWNYMTNEIGLKTFFKPLGMGDLWVPSVSDFADEYPLAMSPFYILKHQIIIYFHTKRSPFWKLEVQ